MPEFKLIHISKRGPKHPSGVHPQSGAAALPWHVWWTISHDHTGFSLYHVDTCPLLLSLFTWWGMSWYHNHGAWMDGQNRDFLIDSLRPGSKWCSPCRQLFQEYFFEWKHLGCNIIFVKNHLWDLTDDESSSVQVMVWHQAGDKPLPEPMMTQFTDAYMHHQF